MNRPVGFYWVYPTQTVHDRFSLPEWVVAFFTGTNFWLPGYGGPMDETDFERITAPLTPPPAGYTPA